ncbi:MAG: hypothetical protein NTW98_00935, partial [Candidatus Nomurabacteria bacterium]|nr:hypothetical protein [Candidatus Nomurabacteria bacterium]
SAIADASAKHYLDEHYEKQSHEIEEEIKKMETAEPTVDDIDSEMSQLKNQISHMGADEKETSDLLKEKFNTLSNEKHSLIQEQESPASRNSSDAETITVADHPVENSNENENLFSTKNLAGAWKVNDPQHEVEKVIPGDTPTIEKKIPVTGSTVVEEENNVQKPSPEKTEIKGTAKESLPSETPKVKEISGMDPKFVVDKGLGVTHAFREQVGADAKLGSALADQIGYEGKVGTPAFYKALGQHFGYIDKNGDEVRVKWGGKGGMAAYEFVKDAKGNYEVKESHLVGNNWENTETNKDGMEFEGKTEDNIENPKYNPKETHDYEYLHERKVRGPILKETNGPKETIPTGPKQEEIIPVAKKEEVLLKEEVVSRPEPAPKERVRIVRQAPQGNGLVKAGYMVGGDYMANADYGARGDNTSPYPNFPGGMPPGMEMYNFTPEEIRDIQMEAGSLSEGRSVVLQKMMMNVARNPNMGPNLPVIVYQDIALKGETEMNADLNKIINGGGRQLKYSRRQGAISKVYQ